MFRSRNLFSNLWSRAMAANRHKPASPRPRRARPQLEYLEDRIVPAVIDVTTLSDGTGAGTLRSAIAQANTNDANGDTNNTINLTVAGTYNIGQLGLGALQIFANAAATQSGLNLTIQNTSGGNAAISGNGQNRVFDINPGDITPANNVVLGAVTIDGVTIEDGVAQPGDGATGSGGGIRDQGPVDLNLNNDFVTNNSATADGGGVSMENAASTKWMLNLNNTTVSNNHAGDAGGGIEEDGTGTVNVIGSTIAANTCLNQGAGIWLDAVNGGTANLNITNSYIASNAAGMLGGGVGNAGNGAVSILDSTIESNSTPGFGGGFADSGNVGTLAVQNSLFLDNSAGTNGGGIQEGNGLTITNSEIKGNSAGINGGMPIGTTGHGAANTVQGSGGGLFVNGGALTLTNSTIADNTATLNGGGIELQTTAASAIRNSTITGNTALNNAGGPGGTIANDGGGIDDASTSTLALTDDTITGNFGGNGGGLFYAGNTTNLTVQNTIVAGNLASVAGPDVDFTGTITAGFDQGGNLIGISGTGSGNSGFTGTNTQTGTTANPLNPLVTGLTNNGGQVAGSTGHQMTVETEALLPGSPAIGKGVANGITSDERGFGRVNTFDPGAFQFENATLVVNITASGSVGLNASEPITILVTNTSGNALPADNGTLVVSTSGGLNLGGTQTVSLGALGAGQSAAFYFNATTTALGTQTIVATVTTPDSNPLTVSNSTTVNVSLTPTPPSPITPQGTLSLFALGFGPTGVDVFEVDTKGDIFAQGFGFGGLTGSPIFLGTTLSFPVLEFQNNMLLGFLETGGQRYLVDVFSFFNPFVEPALLAGLHI
jgi:parallel beta-helix repeat protein